MVIFMALMGRRWRFVTLTSVGVSEFQRRKTRDDFESLLRRESGDEGVCDIQMLKKREKRDARNDSMYLKTSRISHTHTHHMRLSHTQAVESVTESFLIRKDFSSG
jgi:hypothetical protein